MKFDNMFVARFGMQVVDVLGNHGLQES